jgi:hypothetical protein
MDNEVNNVTPTVKPESVSPPVEHTKYEMEALKEAVLEFKDELLKKRNKKKEATAINEVFSPTTSE